MTVNSARITPLLRFVPSILEAKYYCLLFLQHYAAEDTRNLRTEESHSR
jgi:hypothetical protein